jgi:hypothetical protein
MLIIKTRARHVDPSIPTIAVVVAIQLAAHMITTVGADGRENTAALVDHVTSGKRTVALCAPIRTYGHLFEAPLSRCPRCTLRRIRPAECAANTFPGLELLGFPGRFLRVFGCPRLLLKFLAQARKPRMPATRIAAVEAIPAVVLRKAAPALNAGAVRILVADRTVQATRPPPMPPVRRAQCRICVVLTPVTRND